MYAKNAIHALLPFTIPHSLSCKLPSVLRMTLCIGAFVFLSACQSVQKAHMQPSEALVKQLQQIELDGRDNGIQYTLDEYYAIAESTRNIPIIKRGVQLAAVNSAYGDMIKFAELWHRVDKLDTDPLLVVISGYFKQADTASAAATTLEYIKRYKPLAPTESIKDYNSLDDAQKAAYVAALDAQSDAMKRYPAYWQLRTNIAYVDQQFDLAKAINAQGLSLHGSNTKLLIQQAELEESPEAALKLLEKSVAKHPNDKVLNLYYTRQLLNQGETTQAISRYERLAEQYPDDEDIQFSYALLLINDKQDDKAINKLNSLLSVNENRANYVLGALYEDKNDRENAFKHFSQVGPETQSSDSDAEDYYLDAQIRVIRLLNYKKDYDTALAHIEALHPLYPDAYTSLVQLEAETVSQAGRHLEGYAILSLLLHQDPHNETFLYNRAMLAGSYGEIDLFEEDMRALIAKQPNNPTYLNALGYTLAEHNMKLDEAETLLRQALALDPDSAAINDSWGWLQYRLGNLKEAIVFIELAHQQFYDGEIVAHLGELYWQNGERERAITLWNDYLKTDPEHKVLRETMQRFNQL